MTRLLLVFLAACAAASPAPPAAPVRTGGAHDFDWELGAWKTHVRRLQHPLSGSSTWVEYDGTTVVRPVWDGRANLVELEVAGPAGRIEGLSLRLYDASARTWSLHYANAASPALDTPMRGGFAGGRGEFYAADMLGGRPILVRFVIAPAGADAWRFEQAFSPDGGKTWEVNWIATDERVSR